MPLYSCSSSDNLLVPLFQTFAEVCLPVGKDQGHHLSTSDNLDWIRVLRASGPELGGAPASITVHSSMALCNDSPEIRHVLGQGLKLVVVGAGLGLVASYAATRIVASYLFGISPIDPVTFVGVPILLLIVALLACFVPARRATCVDPLVAIREE